MDFELSAGILAAGPAQQAYSLDLSAKAEVRRRMARAVTHARISTTRQRRTRRQALARRGESTARALDANDVESRVDTPSQSR
jgi:hypothetical protein